MNSQNFTTPKCVPENIEDVKIAQREREVHDKNRCAEGYKLQVTESEDIFRTGDNPIGSCNKID